MNILAIVCQSVIVGFLSNKCYEAIHQGICSRAVASSRVVPRKHEAYQPGFRSEFERFTFKAYRQ
jgi:hypothetical protein